MRKTKIVCTIGPATDDDSVMRQVMLSGMNVARFNFSHGDHATHEKRFEQISRLREELGLPIATLMDTRGPEIRLGKFVDDKPVTIETGDTYTLTTDDVLCDDKVGSISFKNLPRDVKPGVHILVNDGVIEMVVEKVTVTTIVCHVIHGGVLSNNKGINVPGVQLSMPYLSESDKNDLEFAAKMGFDFIAASFVRTSADIDYLRKYTQSLGWFDVRIIAKIENVEGVRNIDEILEASDGIMVARGDLGVEIPFEQIPSVQKQLIRKGYQAGKQVITATQMLDSMMNHPRPTRAETNDVANAIYDGTSVIMLSGETAAGKYPVEAIRTMSKIAERTENDINYRRRFRENDSDSNRDVTNAISHATCAAAYDLEASAIITVTQSGQTARMISKYRPQMPIVGCTTQIATYRHLCMSWGVIPVLCEEQKTEDDLFNHAISRAKERGIIKDGDLVAITAGVPLGIPGTTNLLKIRTVGDVILHGTGIGEGSAQAGVCVAKSEREALDTFNPGEILVIDNTTNELLDIMKKASGIITSQKGVGSHAAIVGLALNIPVIVGAEGCTQVIRNGTSVFMDASKGIVCNLTEQKM